MYASRQHIAGKILGMKVTSSNSKRGIAIALSMIQKPVIETRQPPPGTLDYFAL